MRCEAQYPGHPDLDYQRATVLETGGRTREALAQFERALKARPEDPQLSNALGFTLADHKQKLARAETAGARRPSRFRPTTPPSRTAWAGCCTGAARLPEALPILERAWQNSGDGEIAAHYGEVLWKSGDEGQARYIWQQALNRNPAHKALLATMARLTGEGAGKR